MSMLIFSPGQTIFRPGEYGRIRNVGAPAIPLVRVGRVAVVFTGNDGPVNTPTLINSRQEAERIFGVGGNAPMVVEPLLAGALEVLAVRGGSGSSTAASATVVDEGGPSVGVVTLAAKYPGTGGNSLKYTLQDTLDLAYMEAVIYLNNEAVERIRFARGGASEPDALVAAINANSQRVVATRIPGGGATLAPVTSVSLAGGTNPTGGSAAQSAALAVLEAQWFNTLVIESEANVDHIALAVWLTSARNGGLRVLGYAGQSPVLPFVQGTFDTNRTAVAALNTESMHVVYNGFTLSDGSVLAGRTLAARIAGARAATPYYNSLVNWAPQGAVEVYGPLSRSNGDNAIQSGVLIVDMGPSRLPRLVQEVTTLTNPGSTGRDLDEGWKYTWRVLIRDFLMDQIALAVSPYEGKLRNNAAGHARVIQLVNGVMADMIRDGALLEDPAPFCVLDTDNAPVGDQAFFVVNADDLSPIHKFMFTFNFRNSPPVITAAAA